MTFYSRRDFLKTSALGGMLALGGGLPALARAADKKPQAQYGLVTYQWAKDWDLPTLLKNCETANVLGVELRTTHKHGVERDLNKNERREVAKKFTDSPVTLVGIGSNERFDNPDADVLKQAKEATKDFIKLSHDVGGTGVKVKPDSFHKNVPEEVTIEQIGKSLNEMGAFGADYGQQIRLEVHGKCAHLPTIRKILDVADHPNVAICWNCNKQDQEGAGLDANFAMVKDRLGDTTHIHDLIHDPYPHKRFFELMAGANYTGWLMLEEGKQPKGDPVAALAEQRKLFDKMWAQAQDS
ncbi:sugar phosphate isomerase/epimerase family protein [Gimesia panareensis]|uniref:Xylose isomerase-like TIM barrel n=1 Tax=Gimesia panareensis TaxID=2527978 RepID=A0A518A800_9PLAN|nr:TIM barrel protein [Gimesia panareensis]QDT27990.1 Xylose isomerase-like TIM barrel [Gimesia panareensis]QDU50859.1 Xylose isomerase-like TIM barrel [Gimesia panareensis]